MVQLGILANFKCQFLQWYGITVTMKEPSGLLGETDITSREIRKVEMQTSEPVSTREATDMLVKILIITY